MFGCAQNCPVSKLPARQLVPFLFALKFEVSGSLLRSELGRVGLPVLAFRRRADSSSLIFFRIVPYESSLESSQI